MTNIVSKYASLVKFSHTIFALPFALTSYVFAITSTGTPFDWLLLVKILLCMVFARNTAMGFNRWADRDIDAKNERTALRDIPAGRISPRNALWFVILNALLFWAVAAWINHLTFALAPIAIAVIMSYSYMKRFSAWAHIVLGLSLAIAPVGAYIAVTGAISAYSIILAGVVLTWSGAFDILYAMQDAEFDRANKLHSIPAKFSPATSAWISAALHAFTVYGVILLGVMYGFGTLYWIGTGIFTAMLIFQHAVYTPKRVDRIGASFGLMNGVASISYAVFAITDMLI